MPTFWNLPAFKILKNNPGLFDLTFPQIYFSNFYEQNREYKFPLIGGGGGNMAPNIKFSTIFVHFLKNCVFLLKQTDFNQSLYKKLFYDLFLTQNFSKPKFGPRTAFLPYLFWGFEKFLTKNLCQGWFLCENGLKYSCFWIIASFSKNGQKLPKIG